jgi:hypothetical protein
MCRLCVGKHKDAAMWLRKKWLFWSRLVRYHVLKVNVVRALDANGIGMRLLGQLAVAALLVLVGGYLLGRVTAPGCAPLASAVCTEAQILSPAAPMPMAVARQVVIVTAEAVRPPAPALPAPPVDPATAMPDPLSAEAMPPLPESKRVVAALTNDEVREMQAWLKAFGFDPGPIDGHPGARTKAAIRRYQAARHTEQTGELDRSLLRKVRREAGHS